MFPEPVYIVLSSIDYLMVGRHYYTAATFASSPNCIHNQLSGEMRSNKDIEEKNWGGFDGII